GVGGGGRGAGGGGGGVGGGAAAHPRGASEVEHPVDHGDRLSADLAAAAVVEHAHVHASVAAQLGSLRREEVAADAVEQPVMCEIGGQRGGRAARHGGLGYAGRRGETAEVRREQGPV